jgi:hypothetical protein
MDIFSWDGSSVLNGDSSDESVCKH